MNRGQDKPASLVPNLPQEHVFATPRIAFDQF